MNPLDLVGMIERKRRLLDQVHAVASVPSLLAALEIVVAALYATIRRNP